MLTNEYSVGIFSPQAKVKVTNKQNCVQYEIIQGFCSEKEIRAKVGNTWIGEYGFHYSGYYSDRKEAIKRMEEELEYAKRKVNELEFAIRVTKKKVWEKI